MHSQITFSLAFAWQGLNNMVEGEDALHQRETMEACQSFLWDHGGIRTNTLSTGTLTVGNLCGFSSQFGVFSI